VLIIGYKHDIIHP